MKYISAYFLSAAAVFAQTSTPGVSRGQQGPHAARPNVTAQRDATAVRPGPRSPAPLQGNEAAESPASGFTTGQAARLVIGQPTFTSQDSNSSDIVVGAVSG